jgi:hypothetical protein
MTKKWRYVRTEKGAYLGSIQQANFDHFDQRSLNDKPLYLYLTNVKLFAISANDKLIAISAISQAFLKQRLDYLN